MESNRPHFLHNPEEDVSIRQFCFVRELCVTTSRVDASLNTKMITRINRYLQSQQGSIDILYIPIVFTPFCFFIHSYKHHNYCPSIRIDLTSLIVWILVIKNVQTFGQLYWLRTHSIYSIIYFHSLIL